MDAPVADQSTIQELFQLVEDSLHQAKQAYIALAEERKEKVRLEKVASELPKTKPIDPVLVNKTVSLLVRHDYLDPSQQEKFASDLAADPQNALKLANRIIEISAPTPHYDSEGRGIPKQASTATPETERDDTSAWLKVVSEGA
jgi:hypothetical protein